MGVKCIFFQKVPPSIQGDVFVALHAVMVVAIYVDCSNKTLNLKVTYLGNLMITFSQVGSRKADKIALIKEKENVFFKIKKQAISVATLYPNNYRCCLTLWALNSIKNDKK